MIYLYGIILHAICLMIYIMIDWYKRRDADTAWWLIVVFAIGWPAFDIVLVFALCRRLLDGLEESCK